MKTELTKVVLKSTITLIVIFIILIFSNKNREIREKKPIIAIDIFGQMA